MGAFRRRALTAHGGDMPRMHEPERVVPLRAPFLGAKLDVGLEIRAVLEALVSEATNRFVVLDVAVAPNLTLHADRDALRAILNSLVGHAIRQAREQVLVSATLLGGRVQIAVTDDGSGVTEAEQRAILRPAAELAALRGGMFDIETWPGQGTTVAVRLPVPVEIQRPSEQGRRITPALQYFEDKSEVEAEASWEI